MSEPVRLRVEVDCPVIEVGRGEFVTVWLRTDDGSGFDRIQCELRVSRDGRPEVFLPPKHVGIVRSFDTWASSGGDGKGGRP